MPSFEKRIKCEFEAILKVKDVKLPPLALAWTEIKDTMSSDPGTLMPFLIQNGMIRCIPYQFDGNVNLIWRIISYLSRDFSVAFPFITIELETLGITTKPSSWVLSSCPKWCAETNKYPIEGLIALSIKASDW